MRRPTARRTIPRSRRRRVDVKSEDSRAGFRPKISSGAFFFLDHLSRKRSLSPPWSRAPGRACKNRSVISSNAAIIKTCFPGGVSAILQKWSQFSTQTVAPSFGSSVFFFPPQ